MNQDLFRQILLRDTFKPFSSIGSGCGSDLFRYSFKRQEMEKPKITEKENLNNTIINMIRTGKTMELKPNSEEHVKVGGHHVCVRYTYKPKLETRMWVWSGNIFVDYGDNTGLQFQYAYGTYKEQMNVEEYGGSINDDSVFYEVNVEEPFGSTNDDDVYYEVNDEEPVGSANDDNDKEALKTQNGSSRLEEMFRHVLMLNYKRLTRDTLPPCPPNLRGVELYYYYCYIRNEEVKRRKPDYKYIENLKKTIIDMIGKGKTKELKPNSEELVKVGEHLVRVRNTYEPELGSRMWEWSGDIIVDYDLNTGPQSVNVYGNYEEKMNVEEPVGSIIDGNEYYEVNVEEPFGSTNDNDLYYEVNDEEPVKSSNDDNEKDIYEEDEDDLDETGFNTQDIHLLMARLGVSRPEAVKALKTQSGDLFKAILTLRQNQADHFF